MSNHMHFIKKRFQVYEMFLIRETIEQTKYVGGVILKLVIGLWRKRVTTYPCKWIKLF